MDENSQNENYEPSKKELLETIQEMIKNIENLPPGAKLSSINHYDYCSILILIAGILKSDIK